MGDDVIHRISHAHDLVAAEAKYHRSCAQSFLHKRVKRAASTSKDQIREEAFGKLRAFLDDNDECQYSIPELMEYMENFLNGDEGYSMKWFKQKLSDHYGDDITITNIKGKPSIVSLRESTYKVLNERWMSDKVTADNKERIIDMAASIILDDIRMTVYDCDQYPTMEGTENGQTMIPGSLKRLLYNLIDRRGTGSTVSLWKCTAIAHPIIPACRPRSFVSSLLLGIAVCIHRKYTSCELVDILSSMVFSDNYREVQRMGHSLMSSDEPSYALRKFTQFVFDNADFNVATITGHNTFHSMGGIACVTPPGSVRNSPVKRVINVPSAAETGSFGKIPIKRYKKPVVPGLQTTIAPLQ